MGVLGCSKGGDMAWLLRGSGCEPRGRRRLFLGRAALADPEAWGQLRIAPPNVGLRSYQENPRA